MSAVSRLCQEWLDEQGPIEDWAIGEPHVDDLTVAFQAGWAACYSARWEPVGGLSGLSHDREGVEPR